MVFNSIEFAAFLPIVFLLYWFVFSGKAQSNWKGSTASGPEPDQNRSQNQKGNKATLQNICLVVASYVFYAFWDWHFLGLIALLPLLVFKYHNFFISSLAFLIPALANDRLLIKVILPVGISFYTFFALATLGWIIFRAESITQAWDYVANLCSPSFLQKPDTSGITGLCLMLLIMIVFESL